MEFQAEGLGFRNFAWLGSNPSDAPVIHPKMLQWFLVHSSVVLDQLTYLWSQRIKLIQVASTSELRENQQNDLLFFEIVPSY